MSEPLTDPLKALSQEMRREADELEHLGQTDEGLDDTGWQWEVEAVRKWADRLDQIAGAIELPMHDCEAWRDEGLCCAKCNPLVGLNAAEAGEGPAHPTTEAERTVASIATMLGWMNVPPREMLEADIRALNSRAGEAAPRDPLLALVGNFLKALKPIEKSAAWSRERSAKSPSSHQEFIRQAADNWAAFETAKAKLEEALR